MWFTEEAAAAWHAPASRERGAQRLYSAIAIETGFALRLEFHQLLGQTEGLLRSIADVLGVDIAIPKAITAAAAAKPLRTSTGRPVRSANCPPKGPASNLIAVPLASTTPIASEPRPSCRSRPGKNGATTPKAANRPL